MPDVPWWQASDDVVEADVVVIERSGELVRYFPEAEGGDVEEADGSEAGPLGKRAAPIKRPARHGPGK